MKSVRFYHCPKTGGMSTRAFFKRLHKKKIIFHNNSHSKPLRADLDDPKIFTFTFMRDPAQHSRSLYYEILKSSKHPHYKFTKARTLSQWIKDHDVLGNYYCKYYGCSNEIEPAREMLSRMDFVGKFENYEQEVNRLLQKLDLKVKFDKTHLKKYRKIASLTDDDIKILQEKRAACFELYNEFSGS